MVQIKTDYVNETGSIVDAVRRIQTDRSVIEEARRSLADALDLLGLRGTAREAVRPVLLAAAASGRDPHLVKPDTFWFF